MLKKFTLYNDRVVLIAITTTIGVVLFVIVVITLTVAYFCWKKRIKNNDLRLWSHRHDHEHQPPGAANVIVNYVALLGFYN